MEIISLPYFPFPRPRRRCFYNLSANNPVEVVETKVTFNEMSFEQNVLHLPLIMGAQQGTIKWASLDFSSLSKRAIK